MMATSGSSEEIRRVLTEVLTSPQFCNAINNTLAGRFASPLNNQTVPAIQHNSTINDLQSPTRQSLLTSRIHEMFPSISGSLRTQRRTRNTRSATRGAESGVTFERDVFVVKNACRQDTLKRNEKFSAFRDGYAKSAIKLCTNWGIQEIKEYLQSVFEHKLADTEFDLCIPVSGFLSKIETANEELNGIKLKRLTQQKPLYLRPHKDLFEDFEEISPHELYDIKSPDTELFEFDSDNVLPQIFSDGEGTNTFDIANSYNDFTKALQKLHNKVNESSSTPTYFNINRENIFKTCKIALQRRNFDPFNRLSVNFVDSDERTEGAIDGGGPTAEMFRLCMSYFLTSTLFEGSDTSKNLTYCMEQINQKNYFYCGQMMGMSILHGYGGPNFLSKTLFDFLSLGIDQTKPNMNDLPRGKLKTILEQISMCNELNELQNSILEEDLISISGWSFITSLDQKEKLIEDVLKFHVAYRVRPALEQFEEGLKSSDIHLLIYKFPSEMEKLFCFVPNSLNFAKMKEIFVPQLNPQGSNLRCIENQVLANYYNLLADCEAYESDVTLQDILIFTTGCCEVPPLGFKNIPSIEFLHNTCKIYPEASTCSLVLRLPVIHTEYEKFKSDVSFGIKNATVFGFE